MESSVTVEIPVTDTVAHTDAAPVSQTQAATLAVNQVARSPFLVALGERVRNLRSRQGLTRKSVALAAEVSERHLANLEYGTGNVSVLVLLQVAHALQCSLPNCWATSPPPRPNGC